MSQGKFPISKARKDVQHISFTPEYIAIKINNR
jgi:hypothetical protein